MEQEQPCLFLFFSPLKEENDKYVFMASSGYSPGVSTLGVFICLNHSFWIYMDVFMYIKQFNNMRNLIQKMEKQHKRMKSVLMAAALMVIALIVLVTYFFVMYEEPTNLNIFYLCFSWGMGGVSLVTIHYFYKDL
jgi:hypothetical protein